MCHEQWALTVIKLLRFFVLIFAVFLRDYIFLYHSGTVIQVLLKLWMFLISTPKKNQNVHCAASSNDQYQGNGFAAEVLLGRDHPRVVPIGPIVRGVKLIAFPKLGTWWDATTRVATQSVHLPRVMAFRIFFNNDRPPFWILKILIFDHVTVIVIWISCCIPNFIKIGSRVRTSDAHNCWMSSGPLQGNGCCHGNRIMADISGMWWDATSQVSSQLVHC